MITDQYQVSEYFGVNQVVITDSALFLVTLCLRNGLTVRENSFIDRFKRFITHISTTDI